MNNKLLLATVLLTAVLAGCDRTGQRAGNPDGEICLEMSVSESHPPIVTLVFGNQKVLFMVDTGSQFSYIDENRIPEEHAVPSGTPQIMSLSTYEGCSETIVVPYTLHTGGLSVDVYAADLTTVARQLFIKSGKRVAGILGNDFLRANSLTVDYANRVLRSVPAAEPDSIRTHDTEFPDKQEFDAACPQNGGDVQRAAGG